LQRTPPANLPESLAACKRATLGRSDRSYSAERPTCSYRTRTIGSRLEIFQSLVRHKRARAGFATGNLLFYGTVGLCLRNLGGQEPPAYRKSRTSARWAAGVEVSLMANWTARAEYLYVDLNDRSFVLTGAKHGIESSRLRIGVDCRF
jgi:opacity protein-like surface antigen